MAAVVLTNPRIPTKSSPAQALVAQDDSSRDPNRVQQKLADALQALHDGGFRGTAMPWHSNVRTAPVVFSMLGTVLSTVFFGQLAWLVARGNCQAAH